MTSQQLYRKHVHSTQPSKTEKDSIISSIFTTITNLPNAIITADFNAHSPLWYSPTKNHKGELIEDIQLNSNYVTVNANTPTRLLTNQTQPTSPDITTASADFHHCTSWQTNFSSRSNQQVKNSYLEREEKFAL